MIGLLEYYILSVTMLKEYKKYAKFKTRKESHKLRMQAKEEEFLQ
jgi:hypothetical protein